MGKLTIEQRRVLAAKTAAAVDELIKDDGLSANRTCELVGVLFPDEDGSYYRSLGRTALRYFLIDRISARLVGHPEHA